MKNKILGRLCICVLIAVVVFSLTACGDGEKRIKLESGHGYRIENNEDKVIISGGSEDDMLYNVCITIAERENDLTIVLDNVNFRAKDNNVGILCLNKTYTLTVEFKGQCSIRGGYGSDGYSGASGILSSALNWCGSDGKPGQPAVKCGQVVFKAANADSKLYLTGGSGGCGGDAGNSDLVSPLHLVTCKPNGGNGGDGAPALMCSQKSLIENDNLVLKGGFGGRGGQLGYCRVTVNIVNIFWNDYGKMYGERGENGKSAAAIITE